MKNYQVIFTFTVAVFLLGSCQKNVDTLNVVEQNAMQELVACTPDGGASSCGQLRTQSPGGWGAPPNGNNPAKYLHQNFTNAFPWGVMIGCRDGRTLTLTSAKAVQDFLPSGGKAAVLADIYTDPIGVKNTLAGHLVALTISIGLDNADENFAPATVKLGDMVIAFGAFKGMSVNAFLQIANDIIGGCGNTYPISSLITTADKINNNFHDGTVDRGFLNCPDDGGPRRIVDEVPR